MVINMTTQNYCMVNDQTKICENVVVWDGGTDWTPPSGYTMLVQATTPAKNWVLNETVTPNVYQLEVSGIGQIGYTWDGTYLTTNEAQPQVS
jgi:hypothetical protein